MNHHPEQKENEVYLGNHQGEIPYYLEGLKTLRLGTVSYSLSGTKLSRETFPELKPMFIDKSESYRYDCIMNDIIKDIRRR